MCGVCQNESCLSFESDLLLDIRVEDSFSQTKTDIGGMKLLEDLDFNVDSF